MDITKYLERIGRVPITMSMYPINICVDPSTMAGAGW